MADSNYKIHGDGELTAEELVYFEALINGKHERCVNPKCNHSLDVHENNADENYVCLIPGCDCINERTHAERDALLKRFFK